MSGLGKAKLAVIGSGKMGEALIAGILDSKLLAPRQITATDLHAGAVEDKKKRFGVRGTQDNASAVREADIVLLCVKPQIMRDVLKEIRDALTPDKLVLSIAAGITIACLEKGIGKAVPVVRVMPNTASLIRAGMAGIAPGKHATAAHLETAKRIFGAVGRAVVLDEKHLDAVTGLCASGPAFIYVVIESLAEGGVKVGLPRELATELVAQTMLGAARMVLETKEHPAKLKDAVLTPAGCTIDGLEKLEEGGVRVALIKAVVTATRRATELING